MRLKMERTSSLKPDVHVHNGYTMRRVERRFIHALRKFGDGPNLSNQNGFKTNPVMPETGGSCFTPQISFLVCFGLGTQHYWTNYKAS
jgi:hypothetical protein